jgi:hypothetical protein
MISLNVLGLISLCDVYLLEVTNTLYKISSSSTELDGAIKAQDVFA